MSRGQTDFQSVTDRITMQMVLDHYRIGGLCQQGETLLGRCPIHQSESSAKTFQVNLVTNTFQCSEARGDVVVFAAAMEECTDDQGSLLASRSVRHSSHGQADQGRRPWLESLWTFKS